MRRRFGFTFFSANLTWCSCFGPGSEFLKIKVFAADSQVLDNVGNDAAWHVARMPCKSAETVEVERVGVVAVAAGRAKMLAANFAQTAVKLAAVPRGILAHS